MPRAVRPMLAQACDDAFDDPNWQFEIKWDGIRAIAFVDSGGVVLQTRSGRHITDRYPELVEALSTLGTDAVLDGEIVVLDESGRPCFERVLRRGLGGGDTASRAASALGQAAALPATFVTFDLLWRSGEDFQQRPLRERTEGLATLVDPVRTGHLVRSEAVVGGGRSMFRAAAERELEGIVAKRLDAPYRQGVRCPTWRKIKKSEIVWCVVIGFATEPSAPPGEGRDLRTLVVAAADQESGALRPVGRVGAGIATAERARLLAALRPHRRPTPPIPDPPSESEHEIAWATPKIAVQVRFLEWSDGGNLRSPVLLTWRDLR